jgi:ferredoxin
MNPYPDPYTKKIRQISKRILSEGKVDAVIGFRRGSLGVMSEPFIAKTQEATESLTFDCNCRMNLVTYLTNRTDKIGLLVKGCDSRNLVTHIIENIEALRVEEKQNFFDALLSGCTRCYACRNACPLCYCPTCFVDGSRPQWVGKTTDPTDIKTWHLLRAFHDAGRCTDCGACEAACPMDIKIRVFTRKTIKECVEKYGWETGLCHNGFPSFFKKENPLTLTTKRPGCRPKQWFSPSLKRCLRLSGTRKNKIVPVWKTSFLMKHQELSWGSVHTMQKLLTY